MTSSLMETSEDEEAKKKEAEKKKSKKGLTSEELKMDVNIELTETNTSTILFLPSIHVVDDQLDEYNRVIEMNKKYEELERNKVGSDTYHDRGSQTINLTQKTRDVNQRGFTTADIHTQSSKWDISDSTQEKERTEAEKFKADYEAQIFKTMSEQLKHPQCLIDAEAASHISIKSLDNTATGSKQANKSGTTSSKSGKGSSKQKSSQSQSNIKESQNKSQTSD